MFWGRTCDIFGCGVLMDIPEDFLPLKWTRVVFLDWAIEVLTPLLYRLLGLNLKRAQSARKTPSIESPMPQNKTPGRVVFGTLPGAASAALGPALQGCTVSEFIRSTIIYSPSYLTLPKYI